MHKYTQTIAHRVRKANWRMVFRLGGVTLLGALMLVQLLYPGDRLLPFAKIDGQRVGMMSKQEAVQLLNRAYSQHTVAVYMGNDTTPLFNTTLERSHVRVDTAALVERANYAVWQRLIPTSLFWAQMGAGGAPEPQFEKEFETFVDTSLMKECAKKPVNASLRAVDTKLVVVPAANGGECDRSSVMKELKSMRPTLQTPTSLRVSQKQIPPNITDAIAEAYAEELNTRLKNGILVGAGSSQLTIPGAEVVKWIDTEVKGDALEATVQSERATDYLLQTIGPKVVISPGVSYITTIDFTEQSRVNGANGQALDVVQTTKSIQQVVLGVADTATAVTVSVPPTEQYTRTYSASDAGLSALLANYAKDHSGTFGITLVELDGRKRRANVNGDKKYVTASTYKLFVAFSVLKRIDAGTRSWEVDAPCFNKMISLSDNACAEGFQAAIGGGSMTKGASALTKEITAIGLKGSNFTETGGPFTTSNDLALFLGMVQSGQNVSPIGRERLIAAMNANVYRKGIPLGAAGSVANKVGFMDSLLHDAAIVYSPTGTYVLVVMTESSSWATIAELAKQIDGLRAQ